MANERNVVAVAFAIADGFKSVGVTVPIYIDLPEEHVEGEG